VEKDMSAKKAKALKYIGGHTTDENGNRVPKAWVPGVPAANVSHEDMRHLDYEDVKFALEVQPPIYEAIYDDPEDSENQDAAAKESEESEESEAASSNKSRSASKPGQESERGSSSSAKSS
jgi:hypothetical protein